MASGETSILGGTKPEAFYKAKAVSGNASIFSCEASVIISSQIKVVKTKASGVASLTLSRVKAPGFFKLKVSGETSLALSRAKAPAFLKAKASGEAILALSKAKAPIFLKAKKQDFSKRVKVKIPRKVPQTFLDLQFETV